MYANLNEEDGTVACWPCAMDRAPLLSVPPVTLAIFSEVPLKEFEESYQKVLYEDAMQRSKQNYEKKNISSEKTAPKLDEAFLLSVTDYQDDDDKFHEDGGEDDDVPPGIDVDESQIPPGVIIDDSKNNQTQLKSIPSISSITSLPDSPAVFDSKPPGLSLRKSKLSPPPPPTQTNNDTLVPTQHHKMSPRLSREIIRGVGTSSSKKKNLSVKRMHDEDVGGPFLVTIRDRLVALEAQVRRHSKNNEDILKGLHVQEMSSRVPEETNSIMMQMKQLSNRIMRMESKMTSFSSTTQDEADAKMRVLDVENTLHGEMRVVARRLRLFEQRRSEDHTILEDLVKENTRLRNRIESMERKQQTLMRTMKDEHESFVESTKATNAALQREIEALQRLLIRQNSPSSLDLPPPPPVSTVERMQNIDSSIISEREEPKARRALMMFESDTKLNSGSRRRDFQHNVTGFSRSRDRRRSPKEKQLDFVRSRNRLLERQIERLENRLPY